jgi:poly-gamma-glutamate synthesis protein (capsule biosynthesis protein)
MPFLFLFCLFLLLPQGTAAEAVTINAVGDIMLAGSGAAFFKKHGYDYPFAGTETVLQQADIVTGNLESPIADSGEEFTDKKFRFRTDPAAAPALKKAGFTHLSLANNHILDFGAAALGETRKLLSYQGITSSGAGTDLTSARKESIVTVKGKRIAFLSYSLTYPAEFFATVSSPGTAPGFAQFFIKDITRVKALADHVIVSFHWGTEGSNYPKEYQKVTARRAIDAGADIILGHHPHVLQGIEYYKEGVIFYSLGNFAFASMSRTADRSIIARITIDDGIKEVEIIPLNVINSEVCFQPKVLSGAAAARVSRRLDNLSSGMGTAIVSIDGRYVARPVSATPAEPSETVQISQR